MFHCKSSVCVVGRGVPHILKASHSYAMFGTIHPTTQQKHPRRPESSGRLHCEPKVSCLPSTFISVKTKGRKRERVTRKLWEMQPSRKPENTYNLG